MMKISVARIKEIKSGRISDPGIKGSCGMAGVRLLAAQIEGQTVI